MAASSSLHPVTKWAQRKDRLLITFCVEDCEDVDVKFKPKKIVFLGKVESGKKSYKAELNLLKEIIPFRSCWDQTSRSVFVKAQKKDDGPFWPRLLNTTTKQHWLKVDFDKWKDEDDSSSNEDPDEKYGQFMHNPDCDDLYDGDSEDNFYSHQQSYRDTLNLPHLLSSQMEASMVLLDHGYDDPVTTSTHVFDVIAKNSTFQAVIDKCVTETGFAQAHVNLTGSLVLRDGDHGVGSYLIRVVIWVLRPYPKTAPIVYVKPLDGYRLKPTRYVDPQGKVTTPFLRRWKHTDNLVKVMINLADVFGTELPILQVVSKATYDFGKSTNTASKHQVSNDETTVSFKFYPPMSSFVAQERLINYIKYSPEHLGRLEQEMKQLAEIKMARSHINCTFTVKDSRRERAHKSRCINTLRTFFAEFSAQSERVTCFDPLLHTNGDTLVEEGKRGGSKVEVWVVGLAKNVAKKMDEIRNYDRQGSGTRQPQSSTAFSPCPVSTITREMDVPEWTKKYLNTTINEGIKKRWVDVDRDISDKLVVDGTTGNVNAFCNDVKAELSLLLKRYMCEAVEVPKQFHKNIVGSGGSKIKELKKTHDVEIEMPPQNSSSLDIIVEGLIKNVPYAVEEIKSMVDVLSGKPASASVLLSYLDHVLAVVGYTGKFLRRMKDDFKVNMHYTVNPPKIHIYGKHDKVREAEKHIYEVINNLGDFVALRIRIQQSRFADFIGKGGCNIQRLVKKFPGVLEVILPDKTSQDRDIHLTGDKTAVLKIFDDIKISFNAEFLGYTYNLLPVWRQDRARGAVGGHGIEFGCDDDFQRCPPVKKTLMFECPGPEPILKFIFNSVVHLKEIRQEVTPDGDITHTLSWDAVEITLYPTNWHPQMEQFLIETNKNVMEKLFREYACEEIHFPSTSSVERKDLTEKDLTVKWSDDGQVVVVTGLKTAVEDKIVELDMIKNKKKSLTYKWYCGQNQLLKFVSGSASQTDKLKSFIADIGTMSFTEKEVIIVGDVLETEEKDWNKKCKEKLRTFFGNYSMKVIQFHPLCSIERNDSETADLKVKWTDNKTSVVVCGLRNAVDTKVVALESAKKKKKSVSYRIFTDKYLLIFVKESASQLQELQNELKDIGSPVITDAHVVVNGEILEMSPTYEWEEKLKKAVANYFKKLSIEKIEIPKEAAHCASRFTEHRPDVITRWVEEENKIIVFGLRQQVTMKIGALKLTLASIKDQKESSAQSSKSTSLAPKNTQSQLAKLTMTDIDPMRKKCAPLHLKSEFPNVSVENTSKGLLLKGPKDDVRQAQAYTNKLYMNEFLVQKYGVYSLLNENRMMMDLTEIKFGCKIQIEKAAYLREKDGDSFECIEDEASTDDEAYGKLIVTIEEGDIRTQKVDVIVNTTDSTFSFSGPLSRAILAKAGPQVRRACTNFTPISGSVEMFVTAGGHLHCTNIFHVVIPKSTDSMSEFIVEILTEADRQGWATIAMPTIGAGGGGWKSHDVALGMHLALSTFKFVNLPKLKRVKIVLFPSMPHSDKQEFYNHIKTSSTAKLQNQTSTNNKGRKKSKSGAGGKNGEHAKVLLSSTVWDHVANARKEMDKFIDLHMKDFKLTDKAVARLKSKQFDEIRKIATENGVRIKADCRKAKHTIEIQGRGENASKAQDEIRKILADTLSVFPDNWMSMGKDDRPMKVRLSPSSKEYKHVQALFMSRNTSLTDVFTLVSIDRVQNPRLYQLYQLRKELISEKVANSKIERQLFHGTSEDTVDRICAGGFDRGFAGKNATLYGRGVYFSVASSYANSYALPQVDGLRHMFLADVLTGDYCLGQNNMPAPGINPATCKPFDSAVDDVISPGIFVVFRDNSVYPTYIISYRCTYPQYVF